MSLSNVGRVSAAARAREPRHLHVVAYFDGWAQAAHGARPAEYPRRLTLEEGEAWREGWREGAHDATNCPEHDAHWCSTCPHPWGPHDRRDA